ncbi:mRNA-binding ribosome synthesis protein nop7 [Spiromyces aspiralis]|uniref:mRNA-binding ribosome synthesis protein nop7 n=1 Tax=Spiromyces aspiralis TaxID=68401 RepID=A0ACC1HHJ9_9FUNG|nr:mRNA-binding ribosome synthesis protein nop7 [Spiromyces aspiralis]
MAKIKKKGTAGAAVKYITRTRAIKKLQISLADFRRLCILKGIYPVEPKNRKKANKGSTAPTTFYYAKDIRFLSHEPLIEKFRENKIFLRKIQRAIGRREWAEAKALEASRPVYTLDHLVRERYPSFGDALRDIDDAVSMMCLFSQMPSTKQVNSDVIDECRRLYAEFQHYVIRTHSLRKVFLSIKGIYYQAQVHGQPITWITPYQFSQNIPLDVDFRVMRTFLEFYCTLMGFVNYKLFSELNIVYPPKLDKSLDDNGAGLSALRIELPNAGDLVDGQEANEDRSESGSKDAELSRLHKQRLTSLRGKLKDIADREPHEEGDPTESDGTAAAGISNGSSLQLRDSGSGNGIDNGESRTTIFSGQVVYLSREVPRDSLIFVLSGLGAKVGWDESVSAGSPFAENNESITVQISDRPVQGHQYLSRFYVQPQWVYDSVNAGHMLATEPYAIGATLPPHLSPFVEYKEGDYVPEGANVSASAAIAAEGFQGEVTDMKPEDQEIDSDEESDDGGIEGEIDADQDEEDEDEDDNADQDSELDLEEQYQRELEAEAAGIPFSKYQQQRQQAKTSTANKRRKSTAADTSSTAKNRNVMAGDEGDLTEMAVSMLSKKKRKLYESLQRNAKQKFTEIENLKKKKAELNRAKPNKAPPAHKLKSKKK